MESSAPQLQRPTPEAIHAAWNELMADPLLSLPSLKTVALAGQVPDCLRSLYWRYFFSLLPTPSPPSSSTTQSYHDHLSRTRSEYSELRDRYLRSPDGGWVNDGASALEDSKGKAKQVERKSELGVQVNNPLSLESGNPWQEWFADLELRRTIRQDVQRTFPDVDYFRQSDVQDKMTDLLFIYCKLNSDLSYRQGLHELLAPFLWTVDYDSLPISSSSKSLAEVILSRQYIEHDTWSLFNALMKAAKPLYDFSPSVALPIDKVNGSTTANTLASNQTGLGIGVHSPAATVLVQPIVSKAIRIHDTLLRTIDPLLHAKLEHLKIEPQLYALRWLRLLFSREFPLPTTLLIWDGLFAEDPSLRLMEQICIVMLERIRDACLGSDYSGVLQLLLRFPELEQEDQKVPLLLMQAIFLRDNVSAEAGEQIRTQNREVGAVAGLASGEDEWDRPASRARGGGGTMGRRGHGRTQSLAQPPAGSTAVAAFLAEGGGFVGDLAKGVYGRAEALGINKALFGTLNELKRSTSQPRDPLSLQPSPPPWKHQPVPPVRDYLSEIARLRASNSAMSRAVNVCVDVLERGLSQPEPSTSADEEKDEVAHRSPSGDALMAVTVLKHVRDVLSGQAGSFDANVLSPLLHATETFSPPPPQPPSPDIRTISPPASKPLPPIVPGTPSPPSEKTSPGLSPRFVPSPSTGMARTLSAESAGSARSTSSSITTPPLLVPPSSTSSAASPRPAPAALPPPTSTLPRTSFTRPVPKIAPPPPPTSLPISTTPSSSLQSTPLGAHPPAPSVQQQKKVSPTLLSSTASGFPPRGFSVRPPGGDRKKSIVVDPLGAMR